MVPRLLEQTGVDTAMLAQVAGAAQAVVAMLREVAEAMVAEAVVAGAVREAAVAEAAEAAVSGVAVAEAAVAVAEAAVSQEAAAQPRLPHLARGGVYTRWWCPSPVTQARCGQRQGCVLLPANGCHTDPVHTRGTSPACHAQTHKVHLQHLTCTATSSS